MRAGTLEELEEVLTSSNRNCLICVWKACNACNARCLRLIVKTKSVIILFIAGSLFQGTVYAAVGYFNYVFQGGPGGNNLFGNPLDTQHDFLSEIISHPPEGATVSLW